MVFHIGARVHKKFDFKSIPHFFNIANTFAQFFEYMFNQVVEKGDFPVQIGEYALSWLTM